MLIFITKYCYKVILLLLCGAILSFCSCETTATKHLVCTECQSINNNKLSSINGNYSSQIWPYLAPRAINTKTYDTSERVKLSVLDAKHIKATLTQNDSILSTTIVKGKIKNGYFSARAKYRVLGLPLIFFAEYSNKLDFSLSNKDELYMAISEHKFGQVVLFCDGENYQWCGVYKKQ